ncbi:MAG: hypothetical protein AVDCRST_MAG26-3935, partial [uncultured Chloroflexia bacterium]
CIGITNASGSRACCWRSLRPAVPRMAGQEAVALELISATTIRMCPAQRFSTTTRP